MNVLTKVVCLLAVVLVAWTPLQAQIGEPIMTESGELLNPSDTLAPPIDGVVERNIIGTKRVIPYDNPRQADLFWKKRVWRVLDVREKMNKRFMYPRRPFLQILIDAATGVNAPNGELPPLRIFADESCHPDKKIDTAQLNQILYQTDTVTVKDPVTYEVSTRVVKNDINIEDVQRFRIKEDWFFDRETSTMQVRIIAIAPVIAERAEALEAAGEENSTIGERAMFWIYYPEARNHLVREQVFNGNNDASPMTWEDLFEIRYFSSYIYKQSNVSDIRLQDQYTGRDLLLEAEKIKESIFSFEHDLWTY